VKRSITLYDTTLRDGMQREGMSVSVEEKLRIALRLAELGIHVIEGGFPGSNPKDAEFFRLLEAEDLRRSAVSAFGTTRGRAGQAETDPVLRVLADSWVSVACVVGKTWKLHIEKILKVDPDENLRMIADSVAFLQEQGKRVVYDAEHFFDAYAEHPEYALKCLHTAAESGAEAVVLCDTNGATLPGGIARTVREVHRQLGGTVRVGIHTHDDGGCAVANSLVAVEEGAAHVQGTINGYGERAGNADLCVIIPALKLKLDCECISDDDLRRLTDTSHFVAELCNIAPDPHQPYVGRNAFAHKGGLHVAGVAADARTFEHIRPEAVGNTSHVLVSELSGRGTVRERARDLGLDPTPEQVDAVLSRLKTKEHEGYYYEAADASFEILIRQELGERHEYFQLESFRIIVEKREGGDILTEATIKVHVNGDRIIQTAEGNGPVNALDRALRLAIERKYPDLEKIQLVNYRVRILDEAKGTGAVTRVLLDSSDGHDSWGSVGVHENVVEASWQALVDSIVYGLMHEHQRFE